MTLPTTKPCAHCGKSFHQDNLRQRYCSPKCRKAAQDMRRPGRRATAETDTGQPIRQSAEPTVLDAYGKLLHSARAKMEGSSDPATDREVGRALTLILDEYENQGISRKQKLEVIYGPDSPMPSPAEYISDFKGTISRMSPKALEGVQLREQLALKRLLPRMVALWERGGSQGERPHIVGAETMAPALPDEHLRGLSETVRDRCEELFTLCDFDLDQRLLIVNLAIEETETERHVTDAMAGSAGSYRLKAAALRRRKLEKALALDRTAVEKYGRFVSPEYALLAAFVGECEQRSPDDLQRERVEEEFAKAVALSNAQRYLAAADVMESEPGCTPLDVAAIIDPREDPQFADIVAGMPPRDLDPGELLREAEISL
jgi:hypothetical protein